MKNLKTILSIIGLLSIGFVSGFLTHRSVSKQMVHRVAKLRNANGFENHLYELLQPTEQQRDQLQPIVARYAHKIADAHKDMRNTRRIILDSMHAEIIPLLDDQQKEKLQGFNKRFPPHPLHSEHPKRKKNKDHRENIKH
jgi:hypothetical protein